LIRVRFPCTAFTPSGFIIAASNKPSPFNRDGETLIHCAYFLNALEPSISAKVLSFSTLVIIPTLLVSLYLPENDVTISLSV
jgi:hypothetical protein